MACLMCLWMRFVVPISAPLQFLPGASTSPFIEAAAARGKPLPEWDRVGFWRIEVLTLLFGVRTSSSDTTGTRPRNSGLGEAKSDKRIQMVVSGVPRDNLTSTAVISEAAFGVELTRDQATSTCEGIKATGAPVNNNYPVGQISARQNQKR